MTRSGTSWFLQSRDEVRGEAGEFKAMVGSNSEDVIEKRGEVNQKISVADPLLFSQISRKKSLDVNDFSVSSDLRHLRKVTATFLCSSGMRLDTGRHNRSLLKINHFSTLCSIDQFNTS